MIKPFLLLVSLVLSPAIAFCGDPNLDKPSPSSTQGGVSRPERGDSTSRSTPSTSLSSTSKSSSSSYSSSRSGDGRDCGGNACVTDQSDLNGRPVSGR